MALTEKRVGKMEAQLERWSARVDRLAARTESIGTRATIDEHLRIDELRVWRALAQAQFEKYRTSEAERRGSLAGDLEQAWNDLAAAMRKVKG